MEHAATYRQPNIGAQVRVVSFTALAAEVTEPELIVQGSILPSAAPGAWGSLALNDCRCKDSRAQTLAGP